MKQTISAPEMKLGKNGVLNYTIYIRSNAGELLYEGYTDHMIQLIDDKAKAMEFFKVIDSCSGDKFIISYPMTDDINFCNSKDQLKSDLIMMVRFCHEQMKKGNK